MKESVKVAMLISYDWELIKNSLPLIYQESDIIALGIDKDRLTWSGNTFDLPAEFFEYIQTIDIDHKIKICEANFYLPQLTAMEMEINERKTLSAFMGPGGWHLQIDVDEYFYNFNSFVGYLHSKDCYPDRPINITVGWITLFKKVKGGYLFVKNEKFNPSLIPVATNVPEYIYGRTNNYENYFSGYFMVHDSWARTPDELWKKLKNWGHNNDFNLENYYNFWNSLGENNFRHIKNFHPIKPEVWSSLKFGEGENMTDFLKGFIFNHSQEIHYSSLELFFINSKVMKKVNQLFKRYF